MWGRKHRAYAQKTPSLGALVKAALRHIYALLTMLVHRTYRDRSLFSASIILLVEHVEDAVSNKSLYVGRERQNWTKSSENCHIASAPHMS